MNSITLNTTELNELAKTDASDRTKGGFQSFMVELQERVDEKTGTLALIDSDLERISRYAAYTQGGYQTRLRKIFSRSLGQDLAALPK